MGMSFDRKKLKFKVSPVGNMVLVLEDDEKSKTSGGILLPESCKIQVLTGMIIATPDKMKDNEHDFPFQELDRIIYDTRHSIPVDLEPGNKFFLINYQYIYAVVGENDGEQPKRGKRDDD